MREIKFRAWDSKHKGMDDYFFISSDGDVFDGAERTYNTPNLEIERVDNLEIMQYTGLKDKNGKEIYEGDVVSCKGHNCKITYRTNFCDYTIEMIRFGGRLLNLTKANITKNKLEIIGNVHQNPELLNDQEREA